ncbi:MAG: DUF3426 domain-containing protein [Gammaproteobacteria bacterium]
MLFTRCPECTTTFRVSDDALRKANGQVRCGRCASVFNAVAEQVQGDEQTAQDPGTQAQVSAAAPVAVEPEAPAEIFIETATAAFEPTPLPHRANEPAAPLVTSIGVGSIADVVAEAELASHDDAEPSLEPTASGRDDASPISAERVDEVLAANADTPLLFSSEPPWSALNAAPQRRSRWWGLGAALTLVLLGVQVANHFRATLAGHPTFGALAQRAYALVGVTVTPRWDVRQYEILDWVANAEPNTRGVGSLKISARIQNRGPQQQPYPRVQLRLKDRWEKAVGSRTFGPDEYLPHDAPHARLMAVGETTRAEMEVVDPGPDAYGFELDVCIEVEAQRLTCRTDKVFL